MGRIYHYHCPLCERSQSEGPVTICHRCETDHQALLLVYHEMIRKWPALQRLPIDKAFHQMLKRLNKLEKERNVID